MGQAVFIRTDCHEYREKSIAFNSLDELVRVCSVSYPDMILEKVLLFSINDGQPCAVTLGFISATQGQRTL